MKWVDWQPMSRQAWAAREHAWLHGPTAVGAAVLATDGHIAAGCNVEHRFRSHDIHAETNALSNLISTHGRIGVTAVLVVADRESFTPCGGCLDWIFELGSPDTVVGFQRDPRGGIVERTAGELMPHYPC